MNLIFVDNPEHMQCPPIKKACEAFLQTEGFVNSILGSDEGIGDYAHAWVVIEKKHEP